MRTGRLEGGGLVEYPIGLIKPVFSDGWSGLELFKMFGVSSILNQDSVSSWVNSNV